MYNMLDILLPVVNLIKYPYAQKMLTLALNFFIIYWLLSDLLMRTLFKFLKPTDI